MTSNRILAVRVLSRVRRLPLAWPRASTRLVTHPAVRRTANRSTRLSSRLGVSKARAILIGSLIDDPDAPIGPPGSPLVVRPVWRSAAFRVTEGRLADRLAPGGAIDCLVQRLPVLTETQRLLLDMSWTESRPILYQPVDGPDVADWVVVRRCDDRFAMMRSFLAERGIDGVGHTYVDLACNYGWFVHAMQGLGFEATGVERDERAPELARRFYGLEPTRINVGDVIAHLADPANDADVMSCFSLVHHYVATGQADLVDQVMGDLGRRSRLGFFFDMGESHEGWLTERLAGWTPGFIAERLAAANPGMTVHALGVDGDARGVHATEYGRTLFAAWRD